jgi:hypothetical protein
MLELTIPRIFQIFKRKSSILLLSLLPLLCILLPNTLPRCWYEVSISLTCSSYTGIGGEDLRINKFALPIAQSQCMFHTQFGQKFLPWDDVSEDVWDERLFVMRHTGSVVRDASVGLLRPALVTRRDENVRSRYHTQATKFLGRIEDGGGETRRHLGVQSDLHSCLYMMVNKVSVCFTSSSCIGVTYESWSRT